VGQHYLKFKDGPYWIKGGTDSPEDFLAYRGFDNTAGGRGGHRYAHHVRDWKEGDPDWGEGKGKGIIGALNYLASVHVNSIYFLPMNIGGDGRNTWPYLGRIDPSGDGDNDNLHFDLGKLAQWEIVFAHAQRKGIFLHFVLNEAERPNKRELDNAQLGVERKLYYRELAARFGHHLAMQWNLCEEYNLQLRLPPERIKQWAKYLRDVDPYDHPIAVHHSSSPEKTWTPFLGDPLLTVASFQTKNSRTVEDWRRKSVAAGVPLVIGMDEFWPDRARAGNADRHRREYIWPIYLSGGNIEFILEEVRRTEDFRRYEPHWIYMWHARKFVQEHLPFWEMQPMDELLSGAPEYRGKNLTVRGQVFAKPGETYALYMPIANGPAALDLSADEGRFLMRWYNPRTGRFAGEERVIDAGRRVELGPPPSEASEDWAVLLTRCGK